MSATFDKRVFFARIRNAPFPGRLTQGQVSGIEALLDACPAGFPAEWLAYCLGTCPIETAWTMQPVKEYGSDRYFQSRYDPAGAKPDLARQLGNTQAGDGARFCGRGYVQLTGRSNYARATRELHRLGCLPAGHDLVGSPALAMEPGIAAAILFSGCSEGWFTGRRLSDYFGPGKADWTNARRIVNGRDRAATIATHARAFHAALVAAGYEPGAVAGKAPDAVLAARPASRATAIVESTGDPMPPALRAEERGLWGRLVDGVRFAVTGPPT